MSVDEILELILNEIRKKHSIFSLNSKVVKFSFDFRA
jgi:hypothetical protein